MTDAEKLTITTIDTSLTADLIDSGTYKLDDLKTLLATHIARFEAAYSPTSSVCIMRIQSYIQRPHHALSAYPCTRLQKGPAILLQNQRKMQNYSSVE
jgi:hypothetical protein